MKLNKFHAAAIAAFAIWGFIPFPLRALAAFESTQILYYRVLFSVLLLLVILLVFRRSSIWQTVQQFREAAPQEKRKFVLFTLLGGLLLTVNWLAFIFVINHIDIQTASFSYLVCPILTAGLGYLLLKEHLRVNQWLAIGLSVFSCALIGATSLYNLLFSLLIAGSYAFYLITQRLLKDYDKMVLLTLQLLLAFGLLGPLHGQLIPSAAPALTPAFYLWLLLLSAGFTVLPLFLNLFSLKELKSATVGILMYINPILNFLTAFLFFGEQATLTQTTAYFLIFLSVVLYNINFEKLQRKKPALN